jgi:Ca2+-binding RTX toxin-like protein
MSLPLPFLYLSKSTVPENSPAGRVVGTFVLIDSSYHVELVDDTGGRFAIDGDNHLIVTGPLDYEEAHFQSITARALHGHTIIMEDVFLIEVKDVDGVSVKLDPHDGSYRGSNENDMIKGSCLDDRIGGRAGDDILRGGTGDDTLIGGTGRDLLTGNRGADHFVFRSIAESSVAAPDLIRDFHVGQGDKIDLKGIEARSLGGDHFAFVGNAGFSNHAGELRFDPATHLLQGDIDGDGTADFAIEVHVDSLARGDLLL